MKEKNPIDQVRFLFLQQEWSQQGLQDPQGPGKNFAIEHNYF